MGTILETWPHTSLCCKASFTRVQTYIASGNVVFESMAAAAEVKSELERRLLDYAGKPIGVVVRSASEMAAVLKANPFPKAARNRAVAIFLDEPPPADALKCTIGAGDEELAIGKREIFVHYRKGMARSKLKIPAAKAGTARNLLTVTKLVEIVATFSA